MHNIFQSPDHKKRKVAPQPFCGALTPEQAADTKDEKLWVIVSDGEGVPLKVQGKFHIWNSCDDSVIPGDHHLRIATSAELCNLLQIVYQPPSAWTGKTLEHWKIKLTEKPDFRDIFPDPDNTDRVDALVAELKDITSDSILDGEKPSGEKAGLLFDRLTAVCGAQAAAERYLYTFYPEVLRWLGFGDVLQHQSDTARDAHFFYGFAKRDAGHDGVYLLNEGRKVVAICVECKDLATHLQLSPKEPWHPFPQVVAEAIAAAQRNEWPDKKDKNQTQTISVIVWCGALVGVGKMDIPFRLCDGIYRWFDPPPSEMLVWFPKVPFGVRGADLRSCAQRKDALHALYNLMHHVVKKK
eukprot:TRINITY_DN62071_c0_g2_i1.p1 TRINITY_DN62071_c0_g2~~TRINITY_DN62071_c0_g2_i1.p1  ORF type:complete len:354 (-),score=25.99 TRINITY_DN62071_c0_g2_i1:46-1107(-)